MDTATVEVTVTGVNGEPTSTTPPNRTGTDAEVVSVDVSGNFSDPDNGDTLTFTATGLPPGLSIDGTTGVISGTIDPSASVNGPYTVTVTATDGSEASTQQTFTWTVSNPAPIAQDDALTTGENTPLSGSVFVDNGSGADSDPDGDTFVVSAVNGIAGSVGGSVTGSNGGTFVVHADGSYTFNPGTAFDNLAVGATRTTSITYTISDGEGGVDTATVTVTVTGVNDPPVGKPAEFTIVENGSLQAAVTATDVDGDELSYSGPVSGPSHGRLVVNPDGTFRYVPDLSFVGVDEFVVLVDDGNGGTALINVKVNVNNVPVVVPPPIEPIKEPFIPVVNSKPFVVDGIVLDTVNNIVRLGDHTMDVQVPGIVIDTVNAVKRLDSFGGHGGKNVLAESIIGNTTDLNRLLRSARAAYPDVASSWNVDTWFGYSVRMDVSTDAGATHMQSAEKIVVETLVYNRLTYVEISNTIDQYEGDRVIGYQVLQSDGKPLPRWVNHAENGQLLIENPIDDRKLDLKITARLESGASISRFVTIQTGTGEVREAAKPDRATAPMFQEQLRQHAN